MSQPRINFKRKFYKDPLLLLLVVTAIIKLVSLDSGWVEQFYSTGIYVWIGRVYRFALGWFPISIGDLLYTTAGLYLCYLLFKVIKVAVTEKITKQRFFRSLRKTAIILAVIYIVFNINWGLNYNRKGIGYQLDFDHLEYTKQDLAQITQVLLGKVNESSKILGERKFPPYREMFDQAQFAYQRSEISYPFLHYNIRCVKRSLYGRIGNYFGFLGYFNPFTGESQLNLTQPRFLIPFVTCHEMAHQLGYASESEANFVGYLTAIHSPNILFHYSTYFDLFNYANAELYSKDSVQAKQNFRQLDTLAKKDYIDLRAFYKRYKNPIEPLIKVFYDNYLKANQQEKGIESYNEVIGLLIAYYKKNDNL